MTEEEEVNKMTEEEKKRIDILKSIPAVYTSNLFELSHAKYEDRESFWLGTPERYVFSRYYPCGIPALKEEKND
jgi:hypothetical protein